ncbi:MAG: hypothetical protein EPO08_11820 [Rhodospirillaceae bacterium]|nr:MAG: hypothetical protein EPO08_11820 [Rhodospirillaceae bacterium]
MPESAPDILESDEALLLTQLLCTRLCHDLAGPVGAVAAGVELAGGDPTQVDEETLALIGSSSAAASRKLKFLRVALGVPATTPAAVEGLEALVEGYLEATAGRGGAPLLRWASPKDISTLAERLGSATAPLLLNLCLMVVEALPVCRLLELAIVVDPVMRVSVQGHGDGQRSTAWRADTLDAVAPVPAVALSAKTIQPYLARRLAERAHGRLVLQAEPPVLTAIFELMPGRRR